MTTSNFFSPGEVLPTWQQVIERGDTKDLVRDGHLLFDPNLQSASAGTPMFYAIDCNREGMVVKLIQLGASVEDFHLPSGETLVHRAVKRGLPKITRILIASKAPFDQKDSSGMTPLHWAAKLGHRWAATELLVAGADASAKDSYGRTPSMLAIGNGHFDLACDLMKTKKALHFDNEGLSELHLAARAASLDAVDTAMSVCTDFNHVDNFGRNAVHHAVLGGADRIVLHVLAKGCDHCLRDNAGARPMDYLEEAPAAQREAIRASLDLRPCAP